MDGGTVGWVAAISASPLAASLASRPAFHFAQPPSSAIAETAHAAVSPISLLRIMLRTPSVVSTKLTRMTGHCDLDVAHSPTTLPSRSEAAIFPAPLEPADDRF